MSASRMPAFSPMAAKPSARLHEVVDLPTPPLPEATAITCFTPGIPVAFEGVCAPGSGPIVDRTNSSGSERIFFVRTARAQVILRCHHRRALWRGMRVKALIHHGFDAAICTHLDDVGAPGVGVLEHPMLVAEFGEYAVDRTFRAERLAAGNAIEWLFFFQYSRRRVPCQEIEARPKRDDLLWAGRFTKPALYADALGEPQHRAFGIVRKRSGRTGGDAGMAESAAFHVQIHGAEGRAGR